MRVLKGPVKPDIANGDMTGKRGRSRARRLRHRNRGPPYRVRSPGASYAPALGAWICKRFAGPGRPIDPAGQAKRRMLRPRWQRPRLSSPGRRRRRRQASPTNLRRPAGATSKTLAAPLQAVQSGAVHPAAGISSVCCAGAAGTKIGQATPCRVRRAGRRRRRGMCQQPPTVRCGEKGVQNGSVQHRTDRWTGESIRTSPEFAAGRAPAGRGGIAARSVAFVASRKIAGRLRLNMVSG